MYRSTFLAIMAALLMFPAIASAQSAEPVGTVSTGDDEVSRGYDNPNVYFDDLSAITAFGSIHDTEGQASRSANSFAAVVAASLGSDEAGAADFEFGELEEISTEQIGDETFADRLPFTLFGSFEGEYVILAVRQGTWVQALLGFGVGEVDVTADLESIARATLPRWPSDDPIAVREDGLRTGGIWNMMPFPEDLSPDFVLNDEFEEGPAPTVDTVVPVGTPATVTGEPETTPEPTSEATERPGRDLPLLPTETPELAPTSEPGEQQVGTPATPAVEPERILPADETPGDDAGDATAAPPSTPSTISPRLAVPFDATVEIILSQEHYVVEDGACSGTGLLDGITAGGTLTLRVTGDGGSVSAELASAGVVAYDTELQQDVCYFSAEFTEIPARAEYTLLAGESVLGRFTYEELTSEDTLLVVIGEE